MLSGSESRLKAAICSAFFLIACGGSVNPHECAAIDRTASNTLSVGTYALTISDYPNTSPWGP
jgi:hypothetical protein